MKLNLTNLRSHLFITLNLFIIWLLISTLSLGLLFGPASVALYHILFHLIRSNKRPENLFLRFKKSLVASLPTSFIYTLLMTIILLSLYYTIYEFEPSLITILVYILFLELTLMLLVAFPLMAVFKHHSLTHLITMAFLMSNVHALSSILIVLMLLTMGFLAWLLHPLTLLLSLPIFFYLSAWLYQRMFNHYIQETKKP